MCTSHRTDGARAARLRAPRAPEAGPIERLYGPSELQRLNVIVTLKAFGMTLAQIRSLLKTSPPPLASVLEMQLRGCRAKRDEADRALEFVQAALATIESGRPLALEELCNLTGGRANFEHVYRPLADAWAVYDNSGQEPQFLETSG